MEDRNDHDHNDSKKKSSTAPSRNTVIATSVVVVIPLFYLYTTRLRRFPNALAVRTSYFRNPSKSIFGRVTSVGDGDNFRVYHTPGGRLMGWGILPWRKLPVSRKELVGETVRFTFFFFWFWVTGVGCWIYNLANYACLLARK